MFTLSLISYCRIITQRVTENSGIFRRLDRLYALVEPVPCSKKYGIAKASRRFAYTEHTNQSRRSTENLQRVFVKMVVLAERGALLAHRPEDQSLGYCVKCLHHHHMSAKSLNLSDERSMRVRILERKEPKSISYNNTQASSLPIRFIHRASETISLWCTTYLLTHGQLLSIDLSKPFWKAARVRVESPE